jgi:type VI secretion system protein VasG
VGRVISDWTGVPLGKIVRDEAAVLLDFAARMRRWVKGQDHALEAIGKRIRTNKSGLGNPEAPIGVFLLVGSSGVGKTETAIAVAELLFGGRQALTTINMSEFQERHTISRLIGSPPGYVGYGEGGVLTEAVRQRPYSVVLLDEVEKADLEVLNLFYSVFDKGILNDGEGRAIDFTNTVIFLTSNLATDPIMEAWQRDPSIGTDDLVELIRPALTRFFKPALLARMEVVPFLPIGPAVLHQIIEAKLAGLEDRLRTSRGVVFSYDPGLVEFIASRCVLADAGARNIEAVINRYVLPDVARNLISYLELPEPVTAVRVKVVDDRIEVILSH